MNYQCNDHGNAQLIAAQYEGELRYDHTFQRWIRWDGKKWVADTVTAIHGCAIAAADKRQALAASSDNPDKHFKYAVTSKNFKSITAALKIAASLESIRYDGGWDKDPWLFHVSNGVIDLRTGEHRPAKPEDNLLKVSPVAYNKEAACTQWMEFLNQIFVCNKPLIEYFQRCVGYTLSGNVSEQVLFACHGVGSNGKSTALGIISHILGDYSTDLAGSSLEKWGRVVIGEGVDLVGARFAKCEEISDEAIDAPRIKSWTGENSMRVRPMRREWITFEPSHKLWLTFNAFPQINDSSDATYRRIKPIPFNASFSGKAVDRKLLSKLKAEAPGILNWMVEGCRQWQSEGLNEPEICKNNLAEFRLLEDWVQKFLLDETEPGDKVASSSLYARYEHWCAKEGIHHPFKHTRFTQALKSAGKRYDRLTDGVRGFRGIVSSLAMRRL